MTGLLDRVLNWLADHTEVYTTSKTGTTTAYGILALDVPSDVDVLDVSCTRSLSECFPYRIYSSTSNKFFWYAQVKNYQTGANIANANVTLTIRYRNGGGGTT